MTVMLTFLELSPPGAGACYLGCRKPLATQAPAAHVRCLGETAATDTGLFTGRTGGLIFAAGIEAVLFTGSTGEFCLAPPPTGVCFFGPPIEVWAAAGCERPFPNTIKAITIAIAAFFMSASLVRVADRSIDRRQYT